jgi:hypothetical protein
MQALGSTSGLVAKEVKEKIGADRNAAPRRLTFLAVGAWFAAAVVAGALGMVNRPGEPPFVLAGLLLVPIAGFVLAYRASLRFRDFTDTIPLTILVGSHVWRFVGLGFVIAWLSGALPAGFGIPEGFGDIIAAAGAVALLPRIREGTATRGWLLAWNIFGLMDLVSAITMGVLFSEGPAGLLHTATSNTALMVTFPVSLIPTFFVPLFLLVHALIFRRVARLEGGAHAVSR